MIVETNLSELGTRFNGGHHYDNFEHHVFNKSTWNEINNWQGRKKDQCHCRFEMMVIKCSSKTSWQNLRKMSGGRFMVCEEWVWRHACWWR